MRYLPLNDADRATMLERIGVENIDALFCDVPAEARLDRPVDLPIHKSEMQVERQRGPRLQQLRSMPKGRHAVWSSFLGSSAASGASAASARLFRQTDRRPRSGL